MQLYVLVPYFNIGIPQSIKKFKKVTILRRFIIPKQLSGMREYQFDIVVSYEDGLKYIFCACVTIKMNYVKIPTHDDDDDDDDDDQLFVVVWLTDERRLF